MDKNQLRKKYKQYRNELGNERRQGFSQDILDRIEKLPAFVEAETVMVFVSFQSEVDTIDLIRLSLGMHKRVFVPYCFKNSFEMAPCELKSLDELKEGKYGILVPPYAPEKTILKENLDLIFVPALVFDRRGYRLGYGGGYYDRFFENLPESVLTVGLGFACQLIDKLPIEKHDRKLSMLITELDTLEF